MTGGTTAAWCPAASTPSSTATPPCTKATRWCATPADRHPGEVLEGEVVILDCNEYAKDMEFFSLGSFQPARNGKLLSISVDERATNATSSASSTWKPAPSSKTASPTLRGILLHQPRRTAHLSRPRRVVAPWRVYVHDVGQGTEDHLIYEEPDNTMWLGAAMSSDRSSVVITSSNSEYTEVRLIPIREPKSEPTLSSPRAQASNTTPSRSTLPASSTC